MGKEPDCPHCGHEESYAITTRNTLRCKGCLRHFSRKSAGPFRHAKIPLEKIAAIREQVTGPNRLNVARIAREHGLSYRGAHGIVKRIRETEEERR
jgi:transposase-like protein